MNLRNVRGNPWAVLLTLSLGFFMTLLDLTIVNIAVPSMLARLHASMDDILWVVNAYVMVLAVLLITAGRLGDLVGKKALFVAGVTIFGAASLACGLATGPGMLIAARAVQGLGAALLLPQTMSIIVATFPPERRGTALGIWGAVGGASTVAGPTIGGLLVTTLGWRWIFFVNVPIGIATVALAVPILPRGERRRTPVRLDLGGVALASAALLCLTFALIEGQRYHWNLWIWALLGAALLLLAVTALHQHGRQASEPLVPFTLLRTRNFAAMNTVAIMVQFAMIGSFLPVTLYLQSVLGFSAVKAGLVMAPSSLLSMTLAPLAGRFTDRIGGRPLLMGGLLVYAAGTTWLLAVASPATAWTTLLPGFVVAGIGTGCIFAPMATEVLRHVPPQQGGAASGLNNTVRQVGSLLGSAAVGAVLQNRLSAHRPFVDAMVPAMALSIAAAILGALACLLVKGHSTFAAEEVPVPAEVMSRRKAGTGV